MDLSKPHCQANLISFFVGVIGLLVQNVADLTEVELHGKVPHTPVSRAGEVF